MRFVAPYKCTGISPDAESTQVGTTGQFWVYALTKNQVRVRQNRSGGLSD